MHTVLTRHFFTGALLHVSLVERMNCGVVFPEPCPGRYCGRQLLNVATAENGSCFTECGACPTGYRIQNGSSECTQCDAEAGLRDYLFLGFYCVMSISVRLGILSLLNVSRRSKKSVFTKLMIVVSTVLENGVAMVLTLLVFRPLGSLTFFSCPVETITDFYPIFFDPTLDYVHHIRCSYEVVYPLYSIVFVYFGFSLAVHLLALFLLIPIMWKFKTSINYNSELYWLISLPVLIITHAILPGVLYYCFEYVTIVSSLLVFIVTTTVIQRTLYGFKNTFRVYTSPEYWFFTAACMLVLAYGILSLTNASSIEFRAKLLPVILAPPIIHPLISYFASPQLYLYAYGMDSYREFFKF